jgi:uncharacterized integral membrane protein
MAKFIIGAIAGIIALIFIIQNPESVDITFIAWTITLPRAVFLIIILFFGLLIGWVGGSIGRRKRQKKITVKSDGQ